MPYPAHINIDNIRFERYRRSHWTRTALVYLRVHAVREDDEHSLGSIWQVRQLEIRCRRHTQKYGVSR